MSLYSVRVLACVKGIMNNLVGGTDNKDIQNLAERCRASEEEYVEVYTRIYNDTTEGIADEYSKSESVDVPELGENDKKVQEKSVFLPGFLYPDELLKEAEAWNREIEDEFLAVFDDLQTEMGNYTFPHEFIADIAEHSGHCREKDPKHIACRLRHSINDLNGVFSYGGERLVMDDFNNCWYFSTGIHSHMMEEIREKPENYAIIKVYYCY